MSKGEVEMNVIVQRFTNICRKAGEILERRSWILPSLLSVVLLAMAVWGVENFNQFLLYDDEFGYWAASAYLTGTDWKSVTSGIPYYSYGYGFLILTPIRLLCYYTESMYQAAIIVNGLLLVGSYWIARNVAGQLFGDVNRAALDVICFVVMLYPSNLLFAHIAWAECTLVFVFWVFVWTSLRVINRPSLWNHIGLAAAAMGLYVVHQRTIAVAIATVMILAWQFAIDKERRKNIIAFAAVFVLLIVAHCLIKTDLIDDYYYNNTKVAINNLEGQTGKLAALFTGGGFIGFCKSMIGKWFYLFVGTLMMAWWGAGAFIGRFREYYRLVFPKKKSQKSENPSGELSLWYTWLLLAFGGNFLVAAIYMGYGGRNDTLLYGRYTEYMIGIYCITGIISFLKDEKWLRKVIIYMQLTLVCGWFCQNILDKLNITSYQLYHSVCTSLFLENGGTVQGAVLAYAFGGFIFSTIIILILKSKPWKMLNWVKYGIVVISVILLFNFTAYRPIFGVMTEKQCLRIVNITNIVSRIEWLDDDIKRKIYYCKDTESRYWAESFQFLLKDRPLTVINSAEIDPGEDAFYIVGNAFLESEEFSDKFYCVKESNQFALVVKSDGELAAEAEERMGEKK